MTQPPHTPKTFRRAAETGYGAGVGVPSWVGVAGASNRDMAVDARSAFNNDSGLGWRGWAWPSTFVTTIRCYREGTP